MDGKSRTDVEIAALARRRHGVVSRAELLAAGLTAAEIDGRMQRGTLIRVHRGVFRVGHDAPSARAAYAAAVLACGAGSLLARFAAAHLHRLIRDLPSVIDVLTPTERRIAGIRTRRSRTITKQDGTMVAAIGVMTVPRTLVDLADAMELADLARACHEAGVKYGTTPRNVAAVLARHPKPRGAANLRAVMTGEQKITLSRLEREFIALLRERGLALPQTNRSHDGRRLDCRWPERRLSAELDSYAFHNSRHAWEQDRRREREAYARGDQFRRYTWADVVEGPRQMLRELTELLTRR